MPRLNASTQAAIAATAALGAGFMAMLAANLPGHLSYDSVLQLLEGRSARYANWHPAVMSWMLGVSDFLQGGSGLYVLLVSALAFGSLAALLWLNPRVSWCAVPAALAIAAMPQLFLYQGIVWKDVLFANACLASFAAMAFAADGWASPTRRYASLAVSAIFAVLMILSRQNGFAVGIFAVLALAAVSWRAQGWKKSLVTAVLFAGTVVVLAGAANGALQLRSSDSGSAGRQIEYLQLYDIAGLLTRDPSLDVSSTDAPALAAFMREHGGALYSPASQDKLIDDPQFQSLAEGREKPVAALWRRLVLANLPSYLAVRWQDFSWVALSRHPEACSAYVVGLTGLPEILAQLKLTPRYNGHDAMLDRGYARHLMGTPLFSHPAFFLAGLACFVFLVRRQRPADLAICGLLLGAWAYAGSYYFLSVACDYRYLYLVDLSSIAAGFYLAKDCRLRAACS